MNFKPIIIIAGEPNSIFFEILFKSFKKKISSPIILIGSVNLLKHQMKKFSFKKKIRILDYSRLNEYILNNRSINIININYDFKYPFKKISKKTNQYIEKSFEVGFEIMKNKFSNKFINGPISKKKFLKKKHLGITEYISKQFLVKKTAMLIYNKELSVCPVTTHLPLKYVSKNIKKKLIIEKIKLIYNFYKNELNLKPKIAVLGLNPHCETIGNFDEDNKIVQPAINILKK